MLIIYFFTLFYAILLLFFWIGLFFQRQPEKHGKNKISVIIAARNEEKNLPNLLQAFTTMDYPRDCYEIIVADDRSTDDTMKVISQYTMILKNLKFVSVVAEHPDLVGKKGALTEAVKLAQYPILAFTDADCLPSRFWLSEINSQFDEKTDIVAGLSYLKYQNKFFELLKNLERFAIYAVTAGTFGWNWGITCTASNFAYRRSLYEKADGFSGIGHLRSGDDDLMIQKISPLCKKIKFMFSRESVIMSLGSDDKKNRLNLETRRGSKWRYYSSRVKFITLMTFLFYLSYIALFLGCVSGLLSWSGFWLITLIKLSAEFLLLFSFLLKVKYLKLMLLFPLAEILYIPFFVFFGIKGTLGNYKWKE